MFDDWFGLDFGKYGFPVQILIALGFHVWDVVSDVLVAIVLYNEDMVYFGVSVGIMVLGSLFGGLVGEMVGHFHQKQENGKTVIIMGGGCILLGLTQLEIFVDAYQSIRLGKKTRGFVFTRLFEGMIESAPQALLQLYIVLRRTDGVDSVFFASLAASLLSMAAGVSQFEQYDVETKQNLHIPTCSKYFTALFAYHLLEIAARMALLGCIGIVLSGWMIAIILLVDYVLIIGIFMATNSNKCQGACTGIFYGVGYLASNYLGFVSDFASKASLKYYWVLKTIQGLLMITFIVQKLMDTYTYKFFIFSIVGITSFAMQYVPLFYVLKWGSNLRSDKCPKPSEVFVYPFCSRNVDSSTGGILVWSEYQEQQEKKNIKKKADASKQVGLESQKVTPMNP